MNPEILHLIIIYLILSIVWLIVGAIIAIAYKARLIWIGIFVLMTLLYIPMALYFSRIGETRRVDQAVELTLVATIIYLLAEAALAVAFLISATRGARGTACHR